MLHDNIEFLDALVVAQQGWIRFFVFYVRLLFNVSCRATRGARV